MDLCSYLVVVVCVIVLEKSLLTVFGAIVCYVIFPLACVFGFCFIVKNKREFLAWGMKFALLGLAILFIIPSSMCLSDYIYEINQNSLEQEVETIVEYEEPESEEKEDLPWYKRLWNSVTKAVESTVESAIESGKKALNKFVDAVSVFVIAYCAIPIVVVFVLLWLLKIIFGIDIKFNLDKINPKKLKKRKYNEGVETV